MSHTTRGAVARSIAAVETSASRTAVRRNARTKASEETATRTGAKVNKVKSRKSDSQPSAPRADAAEAKPSRKTAERAVGNENGIADDRKSRPESRPRLAVAARSTPPPGAPFPSFQSASTPYVPNPDAKPVSFKVGDKAVHPAHGVGEVTALEKREIGGTVGMFYVLRILDNGMKVMVPEAAAQQVGLREIMSQEEADLILDTMRAREVAVDVQPWSRRFRIYTEMIKSKSPQQVAKVLRDMHRLKFDKDLSFGERRLLDQAKSLLLKELSLAKKLTEAEMAAKMAEIFSA